MLPLHIILGGKDIFRDVWLGQWDHQKKETKEVTGVIWKRSALVFRISSKRNFGADKPNQKWLTDVTGFSIPV